jgi:16S rRNA (uracil1498-N3)-methyltransferase
LFDGAGLEWQGRILALERRHVTIVLEAPATPVAEPPVRVTLAIGLLKGAQMDAVVRDATMMGVVRVSPFASERVVVPAAAREAAAIERWTRVAIASAKQCGRAVLPVVDQVVRLDRLLTRPELKILCVEPSHPVGRSPAAVPPPAAALLLVGPEGGWTSGEIEAALRSGALPLVFGPRTLRAEIAPTVALSALWDRWGWTERAN